MIQSFELRTQGTTVADWFQGMVFSSFFLISYRKFTRCCNQLQSSGKFMNSFLLVSVFSAKELLLFRFHPSSHSFLPLFQFFKLFGSYHFLPSIHLTSHFLHVWLSFACPQFRFDSVIQPFLWKQTDACSFLSLKIGVTRWWTRHRFLSTFAFSQVCSLTHITHLTWCALLARSPWDFNTYVPKFREVLSERRHLGQQVVGRQAAVACAVLNGSARILKRQVGAVESASFCCS